MTRPKCETARLIKRRDLHNDYFSFTFAPFSAADKCRPGQFVHLKLPVGEVYFRRAFSVASVETNRRELELIVKVVGRGTRILAALRRGDSTNLLGPLGQPFKLPRKRERVVIVAGGVGFPPLLFLAQELINRGHDPKHILFFYGGRSRSDIIERNRIKKLGVDLRIATEDGTLGEQGLVTKPVKTFLQEDGDNCRIFACGPEGMLKAVNELGLALNVPGQLSLEAPMPCGIGVCLGCVVPLTAGGHARVCCDGPVFEIGEVAL